MNDLRRLFGYVRPYVGQYLLAMLLLAAAGALLSAAIGAGGPLVDSLTGPPQAPAKPIASGGPKLHFDVLEQAKRIIPFEKLSAKAGERPFLQVAILLFVIFVLRAVFLYFGDYLSNRAGASVIRDLRAILYERIVFQSLRFFQEYPSGEILSRVLGDVWRLQRLTTVVLADLVKTGVQVPFLLVMAFVADWRMSILALTILPMIAWPVIVLGKRLRRAATRSQESMAEASSRLTEAVTGVKVVQGFGMERFEVARFRRALDRMLRADLKAGRAAALAPAVLEVVGGFIGGLVFYVAGLWIHREELSPEAFVIVLLSLVTLYTSIRRLNSLNVEVQQGIAAASRVFALFDRQSEIRDADGAATLPPFREALRFHGVRFAYDDAMVLDGIDLTIRKGEVVALVGLSGSGKTTLANLLPRFYDPTAGSITIDGRDLRAATLASLRAQIGLVTQETIVFDDTVRNNIAYGQEDVPLGRVVEAARAAHAHEFIERLPSGYDEMLGERGGRLSMGQRQRITIARALLKDPPILILDEATSALDAESETLVQEALERLMEGRTSLVIAHRLATVRRADRIVVLDAGRIVEEGTHRELLERGGTYARLHALQFQESAR